MTSHAPRIALVTHGFETGGGVPTVARWLRGGLQSRGYDVDVHDLATSSRDHASRRVSAPSTWFRRSLSRPLQNSATDRHWGANAVELEPMRYRSRAELTRVLRGYDLVQVVSGAPALASAVLGAGVPVILQAATLVRWERVSQLAATGGLLQVWRKAMTGIVSTLEHRALRSVDAVLVWNEAMLDTVRPHCAGRLELAAPGVDTELFAPHPDGWQRHGPLLSVCRLADARKGLDRLVDAYALMVATSPRVPDLILAGRGPLPGSVRMQISDLGLQSRVHVRPDVGIEDLSRLYCSASVFLQSSHEEGFGLSVLEAMASGLPVVSTETAGSRQTVLDGLTGWLVPQHPAAEVATEIAARTLQLLETDGHQMSHRARERTVSTFSEDVTLARFTDLYGELLSPGIHKHER